jgi:hypothetical protein
MGSWGCPHEVDGLCRRVNGAYCVPGMRGCVLHGKVVFPDGAERLPHWPERDGSPRPRHGPAETPPSEDDGS